MKTGNPEKYFGTVAMDKGFITIDELTKAINIQVFGGCMLVMDMVPRMKGSLLGEIMLERGFMSRQQIDEVLECLKNAP